MLIQVPRNTSNGVLPSFSGACWINLVAFKITKQKAFARAEDAILTEQMEYHFKFLMPEEVQEDIGHEWGEYDSMTTKLGQMWAKLDQDLGVVESTANNWREIFKGAGAGAGAVKDAIMNDNPNGGGANMFTGAMRTARSAGNSAFKNFLTVEDAQSRKMDSALVYQNSRRRQYQMTFHFADLGGDQSQMMQDILYPIQLLEFLSCANPGSGAIDVELPAIFKLYTEPFSWFNVDYAALMSVQPTYHGPYRLGIPTHAEVQCTFQELPPLYRKNLKTPTLDSVRNQNPTKTSIMKGE